MSDHPAQHRRPRIAALLCLAGTALPAAASADIPDPLRPPSPAAPAAVAVHAAPPPAAPQRLQATRIGADDRYAVIDGNTVRRGERIGDAVVVRIDAAAVTLKDDQAERVLRFDAAGVSKRPAASKGRQP